MTQSKPRLSKEKFLARALDILTEKGSIGLKSDALCKKLGVSRGSFYWHFKGQEDFKRCLIEYWIEIFTTSIALQVKGLNFSPEKKLLFIAENIVKNDVTRYELAVRSWAAQDTKLYKLVAKADRIRLKTISELFAELGFKGDELDSRVRLFVCFISLEKCIFKPETLKRRLELISQRVKLLIS